MKKQFKDHGKIYYKHMKQISQDMQQWVESNLAHLGIFECSYAYYDLKNKTWMAMPTLYHWYCEYLEKGFDTQIGERFHVGMNYWDPSSVLFQNYIRHLHQPPVHGVCKFDLVSKVDDGFEMMAFGAERSPSYSEILKIKKLFKELCYTGWKLRNHNKHITLDLPVTEKMLQAHSSDGYPIALEPYKKARFNGVTLTGKEQQYIEHLLFNRTQKEIAYRHQCSQVAVRKIIINIKKKLGNEHMSTSMMLHHLNKVGVLEMYIPKFIKNER